MSEHEQLLAALRDLGAKLDRIADLLARPSSAQTAGLRRVLSLTETARAIRRGHEATRELVESGQIPARTENGRWYVPLTSIEGYLRRLTEVRGT